MKMVEKMLRAPLPDQLKALLEKFDVEFDASHLRMLRNLANESSLTRYERFMLKRTHHKAQMELNRAETLDAAMNIVLNRGDRSDDSMFDAQRYMMVSAGGTGVTVSDGAWGVGAMGLQNATNNGAAQASQYAQNIRNHS
jgi:hypothetical protein